ncbi:DUF6461 domain-containing protein [Kitasatospora sp. NPDC048298]|uniref:DUF6461 domain-containing protein n=1 Tax=Kitasatospora sp. NPDC048298 TaxID=3364049 RepID=UPI003710286C
MTAHATDYTWFGQHYPVLREAYCLTEVQGISAEELLRRFDAVPGGEVTGLDAAIEAWCAFEDGEDGEDEDEEDCGGEEDGGGEGEDDRLFVAVTELDGWAVAIEPNGYLGCLHEVIARLGAGVRLVSHFRNVNAVDKFHWWEHGIQRLHFEPLFPDQRNGSDAEAPGIPQLLADCGFQLESQEFKLHTEAAFALAERLTDVRLDPHRLEAATFRIGYAPHPHP